MLSSVPDKAKLFTKNFSENSNFDHRGLSLLVFVSITNLRLRAKLKRIPDMVLKNCNLNFHTYYVNYSICFCTSIVFYIVRTSHRRSLYVCWGNVGKRSKAKKLPSVVSKVFERFVQIIGLLSSWRNMSSMVLSLLDQLQIF